MGFAGRRRQERKERREKWQKQRNSKKRKKIGSAARPPAAAVRCLNHCLIKSWTSHPGSFFCTLPLTGVLLTDGHSHYPNDLDRTLNEAATDKIRPHLAYSTVNLCVFHWIFSKNPWLLEEMFENRFSDARGREEG